MSVKFQVPGIFKSLSARQNLEISLQHHLEGGSLEAEADRLIDFLHLRDVREQLAGNLSHGQKQWLEIGMAISLKPKLLLLDEPTAGMSPTETFATGEIVQTLNADGVTILAVEHDMTFVRQVAGASPSCILAGSSRRVRSRRSSPTSVSRQSIWDTPMRKELVLSASKLRSGYGGKPVLQGVDMDVREGEIVAVIGRNGVGKSTLMRTLIGLVPPTEGSIVFKGEDVSAMVAHRRARLGIGYVPQGRDVFRA